MNSKPEQNHRPIRSYVIRGGRLTDSQRKAIEQYWDDFVIEFTGQSLDPGSLFPADAPLTVEIGFGMGDSLLAMAASNPGQNFLGIEVHKPGVGKLLHGIAEQGLSNLKIICHDAKEVIEQGLGNASVDRFLVFFPDPWHKKKHHKRRIIQPQFSKLLSERLKNRRQAPPGHRLASLCRTHAGSPGSRTLPLKRQWPRPILARARPPRNQIPTPRPTPRPRRLGPPLRKNPKLNLQSKAH